MKPGLMLPFIFCALIAASARAETVRNGNELALAYSRADAPGKAALRKESEGRLFTFRFLKILRIEPATPGSLPVYTTREPSSDLTVILHPQGGVVSKQVAAAVTTNDCLAVNGRLASLGNPPDTLVIDPAVLRSKDRATPKGEKELLPEIDPNAVK
jgi:hypothetical protein